MLRDGALARFGVLAVVLLLLLLPLVSLVVVVAVVVAAHKLCVLTKPPPHSTTTTLCTQFGYWGGVAWHGHAVAGTRKHYIVLLCAPGDILMAKLCGLWLAGYYNKYTRMPVRLRAKYWRARACAKLRLTGVLLGTQGCQHRARARAPATKQSNVLFIFGGACPVPRALMFGVQRPHRARMWAERLLIASIIRHDLDVNRVHTHINIADSWNNRPLRTRLSECAAQTRPYLFSISRTASFVNNQHLPRPSTNVGDVSSIAGRFNVQIRARHLARMPF